MIKIICLSAILFSSAFSYAKELIEPRIANNQLVLGPNASGALQAKKQFELYDRSNFTETVRDFTSTPMFALGDFNGDGLNDVIVVGLDKTKRKTSILGLISNKKQKIYTVHLVRDVEYIKENIVYVTTTTKKESGLSRDIYAVEQSYGGANESHPYYFSLKQNKFAPVTSENLD